MAQTRTPPAIGLGKIADKIALRIRRDSTETIRHNPRFGFIQRITFTVPPLPITACRYSPPTTRNGRVGNISLELTRAAELHAVAVLQILVVALKQHVAASATDAIEHL